MTGIVVAAWSKSARTATTLTSGIMTSKRRRETVAAAASAGGGDDSAADRVDRIDMRSTWKTQRLQRQNDDRCDHAAASQRCAC